MSDLGPGDIVECVKILGGEPSGVALQGRYTVESLVDLRPASDSAVRWFCDGCGVTDTGVRLVGVKPSVFNELCACQFKPVDRGIFTDLLRVERIPEHA